MIQRSVRRNLLAIRALARPKRGWRPRRILREARVGLICMFVLPSVILIQAVLSDQISLGMVGRLLSLLVGAIAVTALVIVTLRLLMIPCFTFARLLGLLLFRHYVTRVGLNSAENPIRRSFHRVMGPILAASFAAGAFYFYNEISRNSENFFVAVFDTLTIALVGNTILVNVVLAFVVSVKEVDHGPEHISARYYGSNLRALEIFVDTIGFALVLLCIAWICIPVMIWVIFAMAEAIGVGVPGGVSAFWGFVALDPSFEGSALVDLLGWDPRALAVLAAVLDLFLLVLLSHCCSALVCHGWLQARLSVDRQGFARLTGNVAKTALFVALLEIFLRHGFMIEDRSSMSLLAVLLVTSFIFAIDQDRVEGERRYFSRD